MSVRETDHAVSWIVEARPDEDEEGSLLRLRFDRVDGRGTTPFGRPMTMRENITLEVRLNISFSDEGEPVFSWGQPVSRPSRSGGE